MEPFLVPPARGDQMRRHHRHRQEEEKEEEEEGHIRHKAGLAAKPGQEEGTGKGAGAGE